MEIPYNPALLSKYNCHINVMVIKAVKYLYILKGGSRAAVQLRAPSTPNRQQQPAMNVRQHADCHDKIQHHVDWLHHHATLCIALHNECFQDLENTILHDWNVWIWVGLLQDLVQSLSYVWIHAHQPMQCWHGLQVLLLLQSKPALDGFWHGWCAFMLPTPTGAFILTVPTIEGQAVGRICTCMYNMLLCKMHLYTRQSSHVL